MWILFVILFILYLINNKEGFHDEIKNTVKYLIITKYHDNIEQILKDYKKYVPNDIIVIAEDDIELNKIKKMGYNGEVLQEMNDLHLTYHFVKKYNKSVLYIDKNIEILNRNINLDIGKYIADNNIDIVFRCESKEFLNKCDDIVSSSFMLMKPSINKITIENNENIMDYLDNNRDIRWVVFNSYYYPNRDRYYNNKRSVYYNNFPYIKNKE